MTALLWYDHWQLKEVLFFRNVPGNQGVSSMNLASRLSSGNCNFLRTGLLIFSVSRNLQMVNQAQQNIPSRDFLREAGIAYQHCRDEGSFSHQKECCCSLTEPLRANQHHFRGTGCDGCD